jgi:hypothetical protein
MTDLYDCQSTSNTSGALCKCCRNTRGGALIYVAIVVRIGGYHVIGFPDFFEMPNCGTPELCCRKTKQPNQKAVLPPITNALPMVVILLQSDSLAGSAILCLIYQENEYLFPYYQNNTCLSPRQQRLLSSLRRSRDFLRREL